MLLPSGAFSGAPTQTGTFSFTVTATDPNGCSTSQSYVLAVCTALAVAPEALPAAIVGTPFTATVVASGGTAPFSYAQTGLPSTLALNPATGVISGTPTAAAVASVTVVATDANGCTGARTYTLRICPLLALSPSTLEGGAVGVPYSAATFVASGGTGPYTYTATGLPGGLGLSPAGALSGTPTAAGTFSATVTATDANGCAVSRSYTILVTDTPPVISGLTLTPAAPGTFTLSIAGSGFANGAVVVIDGVTYPATFVSPNLLTVTLPASAVPTTGLITVLVVNPGTSGGTSNPATLAFCDPPAAPVSPTIEPSGNPTGPLTATDFLVVRWSPPATGAAPSAYEFRINGDPYTTVVGATSAVAPPRGSNDPITLHVRAKCNDNVAGPEAGSPTYSLAPPVADFTFSAARVGSPVVFTDTSSPQATSWFWIFDDGATSSAQSPTHTFTTAGTHRVALIASNGSGSSQRIKDVPVSASTAGGAAVASSTRPFETSDGSRWILRGIKISADRSAWLELTASDPGETVVYLRFLDGEGRVVLERRLAIPAAETSVNDVGAYGLQGRYTLEVVADRPIAATLTQPTKRLEIEENP
jgi:PKD repeat protein